MNFLANLYLFSTPCLKSHLIHRNTGHGLTVDRRYPIPGAHASVECVTLECGNYRDTVTSAHPLTLPSPPRLVRVVLRFRVPTSLRRRLVWKTPTI